MTKRIKVSVTQYDEIIGERFMWDKLIYGTPLEDEATERILALAGDIRRRITRKGLSLDYDIYVELAANGRKVVNMNFAGSNQKAAEEAVLSSLQSGPWQDHAAELSPAYSEHMILCGKYELITKDAIFVCV